MTDTTRILLTEDDKNLGFVIKDNLAEAGYDVVLCKDGKAGYETFLKERFDLCILDVMMPKKDGFSLAKDIRKSDLEVPIIFLTAKSMVEDKVKGFQLGADDYITKPFHVQELMLRVEAVLKRQLKPNILKKTNSFTIGNYTFDYKNFELSFKGAVKTLTKKEADLLRLLCIQQGQVLEREMALNVIWGEDDYFLGRSMDVFISKLRKYLKQDERISIQNVHGVGFKMVVAE